MAGQGDDDAEGQRPLEFVLGMEARGQRLDKVIAERVSELSRSRLQQLMKEGALLVNGKLAKASQSAEGGEEILLTIPEDKPSIAQPQDLPLEFLYEDEHLAVLNKASGMVVHPGDGTPDGTVVNALLHHFGALSSIGGVQRPGIVHRLDKETSGCLVVARNDAAHQHISAQFAARTTEKIYLAVVLGMPTPPTGTVENFIGRHPVDRQKMGVVAETAGRHAVTDYRVLQQVGGTALVECTLHSGRTHQIRVHMKHLGHPLLGDDTYGRAAKAHAVPRLMLHAWRLGFTHPVTGQRLRFKAPLPTVFLPWLPPGGLRD